MVGGQIFDERAKQLAHCGLIRCRWRQALKHFLFQGLPGQPQSDQLRQSIGLEVKLGTVRHIDFDQITRFVEHLSALGIEVGHV